MTDLFWEIERLHAVNAEAVEAMRSAGVQYAENEAEYRKGVALETLRLRDSGTPVTIIRDLVRGDGRIAELKRLRDCAEAVYKASQESINVNKLRIRTLEAQLAREWGSEGGL